METFMKTMVGLKTDFKAFDDLAFTNNKNQQFTGTECLQPMADNIQFLNNAE